MKAIILQVKKASDHSFNTQMTLEDAIVGIIGTILIVFFVYWFTVRGK